MISRSRLPKPALDWGLNDSFLGVLNTLLNLLSRLIAPLIALIDQIAAIFGVDSTA